MYSRMAVVEDIPVSRIFPQEITLLTRETLQNHPHRNNIKEILDRFGVLSAIAQNLKSSITNYDKLLESNHKLYLATDPNDDDKGTVVGYLKLGEKKLFVTDGSEPARPADVQCVLDFFIIPEYQRRGWGKHLLQHALELENVEPQNMAYDRPSDKLVSFLAKHYRLTDVIELPNRFVVYKNFFNNDCVKYIQGRCVPVSNARSETGGFLVRRY